jgi:nucleoside-diphosphate-sugar epimerase
LDNNSRGKLDTLRGIKNVKTVNSDVLDAGSVEQYSEGIDAIYHLAYINGTKYFYSIPDRVLEIGIIGTHNILKACLKQNVTRFYLASSSEVYHHADQIPTDETVECKIPDMENPRYSYGGGKIACELMTINYLRNSNTQYVIFRPHNVYGPEMGFEHVLPDLIKKIYHQCKLKNTNKLEIKIQGDGSDTRAFIYIDDAIHAMKVCTLDNSESGIYHIGNNHEISIKELVRTIAKVMGLNITIINSEKPLGGTPRRCPDNNKIRALGFEQRVTLEDGLQKTINYYWDQYKIRKDK